MPIPRQRNPPDCGKEFRKIQNRSGIGPALTHALTSYSTPSETPSSTSNRQRRSLVWFAYHIRGLRSKLRLTQARLPPFTCSSRQSAISLPKSSWCLGIECNLHTDNSLKYIVVICARFSLNRTLSTRDLEFVNIEKTSSMMCHNLSNMFLFPRTNPEAPAPLCDLMNLNDLDGWRTLALHSLASI